MSYASFSRNLAGAYFSAVSAGPVFRLDCRSGYDPVALSPITCQPTLDRIIREACSLALNAVRKLQTRDAFTAGEFARFFGHALDLALPWPGLRDSGTRFAIRCRAVADALRHAGTFYRCDNCIQLREDPPEGAVLDAHAIALPPNEVVLCPSFWRLPLFLRAGLILHEIFHLRFDQHLIFKSRVIRKGRNNVSGRARSMGW